MQTAIFKVRRENLRRLVWDKFEGNQSALSRETGIHQNQINLLLTDNERYRRNLGEDLARRLEASLSLTDGWLDVEQGASATVTIATLDVPPDFSHIIRGDDQTKSVTYHQSWLDQMKGRITSTDNLKLARVATHDMAPEIAFDSSMMLDMGVRAVTNDGIYILTRGSDMYLRRVTKQLSGKYLISAPGAQTATVEVDSLKGFRAAGRVIAVFTTSIM